MTLAVRAGGIQIVPGERVEVPGRGDLRVLSTGHAPGATVEIAVGERIVEAEADEDGVVRWSAPGMLGLVAGDVVVRVGDVEASFAVRPDKLVADAIVALVTDLEAVGEGLSQSAGAVSTVASLRSRDQDLSALDAAVGLSANAAPAIRRRPIHRAREVVRAVTRETGPRSAADVRWLAIHPVQAVRAAASGRDVGVRRERRADLDTLENRGVLTAYDRIDAAIEKMGGVVDQEIARMDRARPAREAFLTERGSLWSERDQPRYEALQRRRAQLAQLRQESGATRLRSALPDLRPRGSRMVRTARVDAEPAYWATFRAFELAEKADAGEAPPAPAPVRTLDELWEQWCTVAVVRAVTEVLGAPQGGALVDPGWFATLRHGPVATWQRERCTITVLYEPEYAYGAGDVRKLHPGRPWRPDVVVEVRWVDGTVDLHVFDAKFRWEAGGAPWSALQEVWWKYGDSIGTRDGMPATRSVWVLWPGDGVRLVGPKMIEELWAAERLRGGTIGVTPRTRSRDLPRTFTSLLTMGSLVAL